MGAQLCVQTRYLDLPQFMLRKNILKLKQYFPELSGWDKRTDFDIAPKKPLAFSKIFRTLQQLTGVDSGWSEKILFHFLEMDYLVGHKPSSFTRKKKMGAINVFVSFSQSFF